MNKNIIRSIFWGLMSLIMLSLGIMGMLFHNKIFNEKKDDLIKITEAFNKSKIVQTYKNASTDIEAYLDGKNIKIIYHGVETKKYTFKLKNGYLETKIKEKDETGKLLSMVLADSVAIINGQSEGSTYPFFTNNDVLSYSLNDGIEYKRKNDIYVIKINLNNYILVYNRPDNNFNE